MSYEIIRSELNEKSREDGSEFNGVLRYDPKTGVADIAREGRFFGASSGSLILRPGGDYTEFGNKHLDDETKAAWKLIVANDIKKTFDNAGGRSNKMRIPPWVQETLDGVKPPVDNGQGGEEEDNDNQDANTGTDFEPPEFGRVDAILTKLSLRGLKYPIDADYGNTQDYIQINQFTYRAPAKDIFFPKKREEGRTDAITTLKEGVPTGTPKEKALGLVKLPMPNSLADSNNVSWGPDQLNALTAAFAQGAVGVGDKFIQGLKDFIDRPDVRGNQDPFDIGGKALQAGGQGAVNLLGNTLNLIRTEGEGVLSNSNINTLARGVLGSQILNFLQFQVSPEALLARGQGIIPNNNLALLFNSPTLREFTFAWKMSPRSKEEAIRVNNILRFFKQGMAPKKQSNSTGGGRSFFLGTPNVFDIHFKTTKRKANFFNSIDRNDSVLRIKTCACTGAAVSYTPEGMWNAYEDGQPVAITLTLRFAELEPIFDTDYDENDLNFSPDRPDLLPVPIDAVGY